MKFKIRDKYFLDKDGNVWRGDKRIKPYIQRGYYQIMIGRKCTSYARLIATYLVCNPYGHDRITYIDGNPLNCVVSNLKWVSEKDYNRKQSKTKSRTNLTFEPDYNYFNKVFLDCYCDMKGKKKYQLSGRIYLEIFDRYIRGGVQDLRAEIFTLYKYSDGQERRLLHDNKCASLK